MVSHRDFLISYDLDFVGDTKLEFTLNHISALLLEFLEERKLLVTTESVIIKYIGSHLILEPRDCPSGRPEGVILPRLLDSRTSERGNRLTVDYLPRPEIKKSKLHLSNREQTNRGEWSKFKFSDTISFRDGWERLEYAKGICKAMLDLVQEFLDTTNKKSKAITLFIN